MTHLILATLCLLTYVPAAEAKESIFSSFYNSLTVRPQSATAKTDQYAFLEDKNYKGNKRIPNFSSAKKILKRYNLFFNETLYCGCPIVQDKLVDTKTCGYVPPSASKRAGKIEIEHVVPASALSEGIAYNPLVCGKKDKRTCLEKTNSQYAYRTADLYNLFPEDGLTNLIRSDKPHEELTSSDKSFGRCDIKVNSRGFTARKEAKGIVARTYMYMNYAYPETHVISGKNQKLYEAWNKMYPVSAKECTRAKMIERVQENANPFVKKPCQEKNLW